MRSLRALAVLALLVAGCGGDGEEAATGDTFTNPVHGRNFPDPGVLRAGDTWWAYGTNGERGNVPTLESDDLVHWRPGPDALPEVGPWAIEGRTWAPEVIEVSGRYHLYYTASDPARFAQCVGHAVADAPAGPFVDHSPNPLVCQVEIGGSIDASPFRDRDGTLYLDWKNDGNCCGEDTWLWSQRLSADGGRLVGRRARLMRQDAPWEGALVEAPTLWRAGGSLVLFYSANDFASADYAVGYARCDTPLGPCEKAAENPILASACDAAGPGHQTLLRDAAGATWMLYHAWPADSVGGEPPGRLLWLDRVVWDGGRPRVEGPTCDAQPAP
jgi:beta-xylosidase